MTCAAWIVYTVPVSAVPYRTAGELAPQRFYCTLPEDHTGQHVCQVDGQTVMWSQR